MQMAVINNTETKDTKVLCFKTMQIYKEQLKLQRYKVEQWTLNTESANGLNQLHNPRMECWCIYYENIWSTYRNALFRLILLLSLVYPSCITVKLWTKE